MEKSSNSKEHHSSDTKKPSRPALRSFIQWNLLGGTPCSNSNVYQHKYKCVYVYIYILYYIYIIYYIYILYNIYIFWIHFELSMSSLGSNVGTQALALDRWLAHASDDKPPHQNSRKVCWQSRQQRDLEHQNSELRKISNRPWLRLVAYFQIHFAPAAGAGSCPSWPCSPQGTWLREPGDQGIRKGSWRRRAHTAHWFPT